MTLQQLFEGCKTKRGVLWSFNPTTNKKVASEEKKPFDWEKHLEGTQVQGLSPVDTETGLIKWLGLDVDLNIKSEEFCPNIFSNIGTQYFCFKTMGGKWRVVEFLDEPINADEAKDRAKELEKKVEKICGYKCDEGHTLPQGYNLEEGSPGCWWYMPYHNGDTCCYTPGGHKLTKEQFEFRARYKDHPIIVASVGMIGKGEEGSRHKALFCVALYKKHNPECDVDLYELNKNFNEPIIEKLDYDIKHAIKSAEKYNQEYLLNGTPGWIEGICGARPIIDAKGLCQVNAVLTDNYIYVRDRKDFFELDTHTFVDKDQMTDWWKHITKNKKMSTILLNEGGCKKILHYLTHAGLEPGIVEIEKGRVKGLDPGEYLNIYKVSGVVAKPGDISKFEEYYIWLLGKDNWHIVKQVLAFMLNEGGEKIQWFVIWHSVTQGLGKGLFALVMQSLFGTSNVKPNVAFKQLITGHSTVIEGSQIIVLNEVVLTNSKGDLKEMSEEFKNFITEPNLIINPKNKPQIEIPNLCNFFVFSNSDTPLHLGQSDRRAFVVNINKTKAEKEQKLEVEGYKKEILKVLADPSAFKHHLLNDITYDREMFFNDAPMTADKEDLIRANRSDFERLMDRTFESLRFPFANMSTKDGVQYVYKGIVHTLDLYQWLKSSQLFKGIYFKDDDVERYLVKKCIIWNPTNPKSTTKQIKTSRGYIRVYLMHNWSVKGKKLQEMTEGELGVLWDVEPGKEDINKMIQELPNYDESYGEDKKEYSAHCWNCKTPGEKGKMEPTPIDSNECEQCPECNYAYKCNSCGECECARPNSKIRANMEKRAKMDHY